MSSGKRRAEEPSPTAAADDPDEDGMGPFEDEYGDEYEREEEDVVPEGEAAGADMQVVPGEEGGAGPSSGKPVSDGVRANVEGKLWRAGGNIAPGEQLDYDSTAYDMLHRLHFENSSLSFGIVKDDLGESRTKYPMTAYLVAGTQADRASRNKLVCCKLSKLARTRHDEDSASDDSDSGSDVDEDPIVETQTVQHSGTVNRLKLMPQAAHICASWSENAKVYVHDLSAPLKTLRAPGSAGARGGEEQSGPLFSYSGHKDEGYAIDWSPVAEGSLATGDCAASIRVFKPASGGSEWVAEPTFYTSHSASVEDIAWSPAEPSVFMSCGCDSTTRVWDVRRKSGSAMTVDEGHGTDVNVMSWNKLVNYLVVTGADDGSFRVWDLRSFQSGNPVAMFHWHKAAITSIEWSPHDSSSIGVSGADDQLTLWDLALEDDPDADAAVKGRDDLADLPPQLYFVHQGQSEIKELHWHAQLPGVICSTAADSFHIFKPANAGDGPTEPPEED